MSHMKGIFDNQWLYNIFQLCHIIPSENKLDWGKNKNAMISRIGRVRLCVVYVVSLCMSCLKPKQLYTTHAPSFPLNDHGPYH